MRGHSIDSYRTETGAHRQESPARRIDRRSKGPIRARFRSQASNPRDVLVVTSVVYPPSISLEHDVVFRWLWISVIGWTARMNGPDAEISRGECLQQLQPGARFLVATDYGPGRVGQYDFPRGAGTQTGWT